MQQMFSIVLCGTVFITQRQSVHYSLSMSSGYPAPELKWYKDDMEMDRYCGLPKYEIRRNGKTHTLHIYKYVTKHFAGMIYHTIQIIRNVVVAHLNTVRVPMT